MEKKMLHSFWKLNVIRVFTLFFWSFTLFSYFFQFPFRGLSRLITPSIFLYSFFELKNRIKKQDNHFNFLLCIWYLLLGLECLNSVFRNNDINHIIRFMEILSFLPVCFFIHEKQFKTEYKILICFSVLKCLLLIGIAMYLIKIGNHSVIRNYVFNNITLIHFTILKI